MTILRFAVRGSTETLTASDTVALFDRSTSSDASVQSATASIIGRVRREGDRALMALAWEFDGVDLDALEVPRVQCERALAALDPALRRVLERAAANIRTVHEAMRPVECTVTTADGVVIGRRPDPLGRVGVYAPGGRARYPSSLLMGAIPARVAGVEEVIVCSPPGANGLPGETLLAAAAIAGVDHLFAVGGAGAIAAMAYGTATIPRVDRVVGPGNAYVAEAKLQLCGVVGIDSPAGPSELLVLADEEASPDVIAREMIAQAEHDPAAAVILVTTSSRLAAEVTDAIARGLEIAPRALVALAAFEARGAILIAPSLERAITFANEWAAEHLLVAVSTTQQSTVLASLRNAGTVFVGETTSVAFGDYMTGANHVLPTGGLARSYSGLSTVDFMRWTTWQRVGRAEARSLASDVALFAEAEGLPAHAAAARQWESE